MSQVSLQVSSIGPMMMYVRTAVFLVFGSLSLLCPGCSQTDHSSPLRISESVRAKTLLLSEIHAAENMSDVIDCPIQVQNLTRSSQTVRLINTGCSCYGVTLEGRTLKKGEAFEITANEIVSLNIDAQPPLTESSQDYRTRFEYTSENGRPRQQNIRCELQVYRDLKVFPRVLICDTEPGVTQELEKEITIERVFRSQSGKSPDPVIQNLPLDVSILKTVRTTGPVELEEGIWKCVWTTFLKVPVEGTLSATGTKDSFHVIFPDSEISQTGLAVKNQLIRRVRVPILFPKEIQFGRIPLGETRSRILFFTHSEESTFQLKLDRSSLPENVEVTVPQEPAARFRVEIQLRSIEPGDWTETLRFTTNLSQQPNVELTLKAIFKEGAFPGLWVR